MNTASKRETQADQKLREKHASSLLFDVVNPGTVWYRLHSCTREALWYGPEPESPPRNRFDAPQGEYRICYCGESPDAAFAETFLRHPPVRMIALTEMTQRTLTYLRVLRPLRLVALHGPGLARAGVAGEITAGVDYERSRAVALTLWNHPEQPDGVRYLCRHDSAEYAIALFDRKVNGCPALEAFTSVALEADVQQLAQWVEKYGVAVV